MAPRRLFAVSAVVAASVLCSSVAYAQGTPTTMARTYTVTPKQGMAAQFEAALREHAEWRAANGDPWVWRAHMHETGDDLGSFYLRSGGHTWADLDAYDAGFGPQGLLHWNATVAPLIESITSTIRAGHPELSNGPPADWPWTFVTINRYQIRPGHEADFNRLATQAAEALRGQARWYWAWVSDLSGGGAGPYRDLVVFAQNWAGMALPDPSFDTMMTQAMGEAGFREWMTTWGQTYRGVESYTLRRRPDMDVN